MKDYISDRETYLRLKQLTKDTAKSIKDNNQAIKSYYKNRADFYHNSRGVNVPTYSGNFISTGIEKIEVKGLFRNRIIERPIGKWMDVYEQDGFTEKLPTKLSKIEARYLNIIYGIIKGKEYNKIEVKVKEKNEITSSNIIGYCTKFHLTKEVSDVILAKITI